MTSTAPPTQPHTPPAQSADAPQTNEPVLSTLNKDGSRRWLRPRLSGGRFLVRRRTVAYLLIAIFTLIPYFKLNAKPLVLLDIIHREFTFFGVTFLPTDTLLLAILVLIVFVTLFLVTALFGRIWCGWACPQTVYMEFLYRPIERLFEGGPGRKPRIKGPAALRKIAKYIVYLLCSMFLAHIFLSYFVGVDQLFQWVRRSPVEHPTSFLVMMAVTGLMMFDFSFFREQMCIVACPYGRFQSVMLDRNSLTISYDNLRGEPRGKLRRKKKTPLNQDIHLKVAPEEPTNGDCIDCHMCVTTCPTGIDIREGLQLECVGCAQCIDACDSIMDKIGKPRGLIRYSSEAAIAGERRRLFRPRVLIYPVILLILLTTFVTLIGARSAADITILRGMGRPFAELATGEIANQVRIKIVNRSPQTAIYTITLTDAPDARLIPMEDTVVTIAPGETALRALQIALPPAAFAGGSTRVRLVITSDADFREERSYRLLGPAGAPRRDAESNTPSPEQDQ